MAAQMCAGWAKMKRKGTRVSLMETSLTTAEKFCVFLISQKKRNTEADENI